MRDELISFETAKLAKEAGFNNFESWYYKSDGEIKLAGRVLNHNEMKTRYSAPTQSLLQKWLREKHYIDVIPEVANNSHREDGYLVDVTWKHKSISPSINVGFHFVYEDALEAALYSTLQTLKNKK
jgi:hypothetical protein